MKRILLSVWLIAALITIAHGQKFYVRAGAGYAFPHAAQIAGANTSSKTYLPYASGTITTRIAGPEYSIRKISFSAGPVARIAGGYMFSPNIGLDLEGSFGLSPAEHKLITSTPGNGATYTTTYVQQASAPILLTPAVLLRTRGADLNAYGRFGITLPLNAQVKDQYAYELTSSMLGNSINTIKSVQRPGFGLGLSAALGARYRLSKSLFVWAEVSLLSMTLYAKESELTEQTNNGVSTIDLIPKDKRTFRYGFSGNPTSNTLTTYAMPFSNIAGCLGVSYDF